MEDIRLWQFNNASWEQDDSLQTFTLKRLFGEECTENPAAPLNMLLGSKRHNMLTVDSICSSGTFPAEFSFCPYCGESLLAPEDSPSTPWIPPYGNGFGLKIVSEIINPAPMAESKGKSLTIPSMHGRFSFCSAYFRARRRLLIAIQRDVGKISVFQNDKAGRWRDLNGKAGDDGLPPWSWSLAIDVGETGMAIPGRDGPVWITIDWARNELQLDRGFGSSVGGAARLGRYLLAPVLRGTKFFMLCRKDSDQSWAECATSCDPSAVAPHMRSDESSLAYLGVPVIDETRMVAYWPTRGGYVRVAEGNSAREHTWEFRPWETDEHPAMALMELGPPYRKMGSRSGFWQLCQDHDPSRREDMVHKIIKLDGDEHADSDVLEYGQFVSTGRASFAWLYDFWTDVHQYNVNLGEQSELRYPLLQFGDNGLVLVAKVRPWQGREDMGLFSEVFFNRHEKASVFVRFVIEGTGVAERALYAEGVDGSQGLSGSLFRVPLAHLPEISAFIYGDRLYIYFPEDNKCFGWPLELMGER